MCKQSMQTKIYITIISEANEKEEFKAEELKTIIVDTIVNVNY